jgi:glycolate oxidase
MERISKYRRGKSLTNIQKELIKIVGPKNVFSEKIQRFCYRFGNVIEYRFDTPSFLPDFVVRPVSTQQVASILKLANKHQIPVVVWGGGTDFSGANSPIKNGIVIDMKEFNEIQVDVKRRCVTAGSGAILKKIGEECENKGFLFEHELTSQPGATLGGAIATNSFGYRSGKYGSIRNLILGIEVVLPTGEIIKTKPLFKTSMGYDLVSLLVGSEGTLGVITQATLKLSPLPEKRELYTFVFSRINHAIEAAEKVYNTIPPDLFEIFEMSFLGYVENTQEFIEEHIGIPKNLLDLSDGFPAILTVGYEGKKEVVNSKINILKDLITDGLSIQNEGYYENRFIRYHKEFRKILNLLPNISLKDYSYATFDFSIPETKLLEFNDTLHAISKEYSNTYLLDVNLYSALSVVGIDFFVPNNKEVYKNLAEEIFRVVLELGGSLSSVHGIGTRLIPHLRKDLGDPYVDLMNRIKKAFDPLNILNPGKLGNVM